MKLTRNAMLLSILIVCSQLTFPLPLVPLTMQTFAIGIIASLSSVSSSFLIVSTYILTGMIGLPVFAGFTGGLSVIVSPLGGYIVGFLLYAVLTALILNKLPSNFWSISIANCLGALAQLLVGTLWLMQINHLTVQVAFMTGFILFLIPGIIKIILVSIITEKLQMYIPSLQDKL